MLSTDITKCQNKTCRLKEKCYRYTSKPNEYWQSYAVFELQPDNTCEFFVSNSEEDTL